MSAFIEGVAQNWHVWVVSITLVVAAVIDGIKLKVPNWITFPMIITGWIYSVWAAPSLGMTWYEGFGWSLFGTAVGLALLLPAYAIGGMGAGDVKLLAGVGAWMHGDSYRVCVCDLGFRWCFPGCRHGLVPQGMDEALEPILDDL